MNHRTLCVMALAAVAAMAQDTGPISVAVHPDAARSVKQTIPAAAGGSMTVTGADGTVYTLTVPANSLLGDTDITMTPLAGVDGLPWDGGIAAGVQFAPEGLVLYAGATLAIQPATPVPPELEAPFAYAAGGSDFHLYPLGLDPAQLTFTLVHFSGYGVGLADGAARQSVARHVPANPESAYVERVQAVIAAMRQESLETGDFNQSHVGELRTIADGYYDDVVSPLLPAIMTQCDDSTAANVAKALTWARQAMLIGIIPEDDSRIGTIMQAVQAGANNCFQKHYDQCMAQSTPTEVIAMLRDMRVATLVGAPDIPNSNDMIARCAQMKFLFDLDGTVGVSQWLDLRNTQSHGTVHGVRLKWYSMTDPERAPGMFASAQPPGAPTVKGQPAQDCTTNCADAPMYYDRFTYSLGPNSCSTASKTADPTIYVEARPDLNGTDPRHPMLRVRYLVAGLHTETENYGSVDPQRGCVHAPQPVPLPMIGLGFDYAGAWPGFTPVEIDVAASVSRRSTVMGGTTMTENSTLKVRRDDPGPLDWSQFYD